MTSTTCPADNTSAVDQSSFFSNGSINWTPHRIGWTISGACALVTTLLTLYNVQNHARHYRVRAEQRQIIRILYMPMVYAIISFLSYRFFREYTYYDLVEVVYEALTISAFLLLLIQYVANTAMDSSTQAALARKDKTKLPIPFCCWRYRPTKPYFMYTLKYAVLQYAAVRPLLSIIGIICQAFNVLCTTLYSVHFAYAYIEAVDFVSISVALYGLIVFYVLTREELRGRRPLAKFLCIKLIVFFTFYQNFVFNLLQKHGVLKATTYWTSSNIVDGLDALVTTIEMMFFAALMIWAYPASEYSNRDDLGPRLGFWRAIWDSINFSDFALEIYTSLKFFINFLRGKPETRAQKDVDEKGRVDFDRAFLQDKRGRPFEGSGDDHTGLVNRNNNGETFDRGSSSPAYTDEGSGSTALHTKSRANGNSMQMRNMDQSRV